VRRCHCDHYCVDEDFGPFFLKFCSYFPYNAKLCINGHEYLKRQLAKRGVAFEALDNGIRSCADPKLMQRLCDENGQDSVHHPSQRVPIGRHDHRARSPRSIASRAWSGCGIIGADARPNWREQPARESLTGAQWR
jgi:hypothetical protein